MFTPNPKPNITLVPRAAAIARALVTLREEREDATVEDLIGRGFTRAEIELHRDAAVAEAARRWDQRTNRRLKRAS